MAGVKIKNAKKVYDRTNVVIRDLSFEVKDKEFVVLVGPSGCGKSTMLRMVAGLESITSGDIFIGDKKVNELLPKDRNIAMVFQNYALYPHMTVYQNMAFGLRVKKVSKKEIDRRVREAAEILEITPLLDRKPAAMSGGQRQRVAIGRAIVRDPAVFLFDEPLSNLDAKLRVQMRLELQNLHQKLKSTMIYVTHDQTEAMTLGDRIVVMKDGDIMQMGTPMELYQQPDNLFVAGFIGSPPINLLKGKLSGNMFLTERDNQSIGLPDESLELLKEYNGKEIYIGIRPENVFADLPVESASYAEVRVSVTGIEHMGSEIFLYAEAGKNKIVARLSPGSISIEPGESRELFFDMQRTLFFDAGTEIRISEL